MASHSKTWNPISPSMQLSLSDRYSLITTHQNGLDRLEIISEDSGGSALLFRELLPKSLCIRDLHRISVTDSGYNSGRSTDTPPWENPGPRYISKQSSGYLNRTMWQCQVLWVRGQRLLQLPYGERKGQSSSSSTHCILQELLFSSSEAVLENVSTDSPTDFPNFDLLKDLMNLGSALQYLPWMLTPTPLRITKVKPLPEISFCSHPVSITSAQSRQRLVYSSQYTVQTIRAVDSAVPWYRLAKELQCLIEHAYQSDKPSTSLAINICHFWKTKFISIRTFLFNLSRQFVDLCEITQNIQVPIVLSFWTEILLYTTHIPLNNLL